MSHLSLSPGPRDDDRTGWERWWQEAHALWASGPTPQLLRGVADEPWADPPADEPEEWPGDHILTNLGGAH